MDDEKQYSEIMEQGEKTTVHVYENEKRMIEFIQEKEPRYDNLGKRTVVREALYALADARGIDMPHADFWCMLYDPDRDSEDSDS